MTTLASNDADRVSLRALLTLLGQAASRFPNHLAAGPPQAATALPRRRLLLLLLLLFCLVPRVWMATRLKAICPDGVMYIERAAALDRGDVAAGLNDMRVNTLPLALMAMHRLGFDWESAGKLWGIAMSTAAILPLFGWTRRQFDDRVAAFAAILYAVHPGIIERTPEIIREPTFWMCGLCALYFSWRAASEVKLRYFLCAGAAIVLAVFSRFEGLFLLIPLLWWTCVRGLAPSSPRARLLFGLTLSVFATPLLLLALIHLVLPRTEVVSLVRLDPLVRAERWLRSWAGHESSTTIEPLQQLNGRTERLSTLAGLKTYLVMAGRGFDPVFALLLPASIIGWTGLWLRRDQLPIVLATATVLLGAWIHLWYSHELSSRYVATAFLLTCPLCALGVCWPADVRQRLLPAALAGSATAQGGLAVLILGLLTVIGWSDALGSRFASREAQAELGRWVKEQFPNQPRVAASANLGRLVAYYAGGQLQELPSAASVDALIQDLNQSRPDVILVARGASELCRQLASHAADWKMEPLAADDLPPGYADDALVWVRTPPRPKKFSRAVAGRQPSWRQQ